MLNSEYVYHDRKMMKWMPFNALLEQGDYINELLQGRKRLEMPVLSEDQQSELNYKLETAYIFRSELEVSYFENHKMKKVIGIITKTDLYKKQIFIGEQALNAQQITSIEII